MRSLVIGLGFLMLAPVGVDAGKIVGEDATYSRDQGVEMQVSYVAAGNGVGLEEYLGYAFPGQAASGTELTAAIWQIYRLTYDSSNRVSTRCWANRSDAYDKTWADRASYSYC